MSSQYKFEPDFLCVGGMGFPSADISAVFHVGFACSELVSAQFVAQLAGLWMVASSEFVLVLVLGSDDCLPAGCTLSRFLSTRADRFAVGVSAVSDSLSQRQSRLNGLDCQSQPSLSGTQSSAPLLDGR